MRICPWFDLTFYGAAHPSTASPLVLIDSDGDHDIDDNSPLIATVRQLVQRADYVRGEVPALWVRGNRTLNIEWTEVREAASPSVATAAILDLAEGMPSTTGWLELYLPELNRKWMMTPAVVEAIPTDYIPRLNKIMVQWRLQNGPPVEIAAVLSDDTLLTEIGTDFLLEDDSGSILLETA